ncbi:MAG TPA: DUF952 domain-containing protein [Chitinophagaceae bacterium]|nr:DUF952 domain-containing protein [Chitinophagaceae bacterium]
MAIIYHICYQADWQLARERGVYEAASLKEEGFIHCSQEEQLEGVLQRYFKDKRGLVKLSIDTSLLQSRLIYEWSPSLTETFPHVYGPIQLQAVIETASIS